MSKVIASIINGISLGALTFVGAVDSRMFLTLLKDKKNEFVIRLLFPIWWPYGRDLMIPVAILGILFNLLVYKSVKSKLWLIPVFTHLSIILWTGIFMAESIRDLMDADSEGIHTLVYTFCMLHLVRIGFALIGSIASTYALMISNGKKELDKND